MAWEREFARLQEAMAGLRAGSMATADFCAAWRGQDALLAALPDRYRSVMEDLLGRLEAGSLFTEESCSFSREDLLGGLDTGLVKARALLDA